MNDNPFVSQREMSDLSAAVAYWQREAERLTAENERLKSENKRYYEVLAEVEYRVEKYRIGSIENVIDGWDSDG